MKKGNWRKGSFTVEAACIMSLVLLVLIGVLYLTFFVHNRAWLTAAASEAALYGSMEETQSSGTAQSYAESRAKELGNVKFFGAENMKVQVTGGNKVTVTYTADTVSGFGNLSWKLKAEGSAAVVKPVKWIRQTREVLHTIKEIKGEG